MGWFSRKRQPLTPEEMLAQAHAPTPSPSAGYVPPNAAGGFRLVVEDVFFITGRGVVVTGQVAGMVHAGSAVIIQRDGLEVTRSEIKSIEQFRKSGIQTANTGDNVGLLLSGITREDVRQGDVVST